MKAYFYLLFLSLVVSESSFSQTVISGQVKDVSSNPVSFANVYLEGVFDGGSTDEQGFFSFSTHANGSLVLVVSCIDYQTLKKEINLSKGELKFNFTLKPGMKSLSEITISAGVFDASDKKKGTILRPLDIVTNPAASADIYDALETLPGVTVIGDETGLFVRGGEASETKTIIDGTFVSKPFFSDVPNIPSRGRFNPFLFEGTLFSTGGYSAQYGQALSSVLILNTNDMPSKSGYGISLNMAGINTSYTKVWDKKTALLANIGYSNLSLLYSIVPQNRNWDKPPNGYSGAIGFRHKNKLDGIYKSFLQYNNRNIALDLPSAENQLPDNNFSNNNRNLFWNNSYSGPINKNWKLLVTASISYDEDKDQFNDDNTETKELLGQGRITLGRRIGNTFLKIGSELQVYNNEYNFDQLPSTINNNFSALYAESDIRLGEKMSYRIGVRGEYASLIDKFNIMPRMSLSYMLGINSSFSIAYGKFYQTPDLEFLNEVKNLNFENATHYISNFQWKTKQRIFRIEAYFKDYNKLVKEYVNLTLNNDGTGFSKGMDIFWRDQQTITKLTYWLSYSLIDAKRLYRDFPYSAIPTFVSKHNLSIVANYKITPLLRLGASYTYASGRTYFNPNNNSFLADRTIDYHNINISSSYLLSLFGNFTVIYVSLKNPFGFKQIFGYRYSSDGTSRTPIVPSTNWSFFAGISISIQK